ncbi:mitochondrial carrier [Cystobasidium minutum MCA 4210]|uniref:mitochondrial carrier n=1 Tax=Cystobasidium minutum MCA 4210 TaxID=1397322 RepID=UPI0034CFB9DC|eukprot:jgi/Rhomi1/149321/estExt_Genewise1.C_1_t30150
MSASSDASTSKLSTSTPAKIATPVPAPVPVKQLPAGARLSTPESFILGGLAACGSVTVTNPAEVAKTRLQLDGELQSRAAAHGSAPYKKVYNNAFDALKKTWQSEGVKGIQRGLFPAYAYQIFLNGSRLGLYEPFRRTFNRLLGRNLDSQSVVVNLSSGAASGIVGAILGNPLFLVKARIQAYSPSHPVGAQHAYKGGFDALTSIFRAEGVKGLWRGVDAAMLRTAMGSSVQLPAYNLAKSYIAHWHLLPANSIWTYLAASTFSGACVCVVMQPADTALTRMYNQSPNALGPDGKVRGLLYKNPIDCLYKTFKTEGVMGWYKGSTAHLLRIAPHTVLTLVFNEQLTQKYASFKSSRLSSKSENVS